MPYDFAKQGKSLHGYSPALHGYDANIALGYQHVRPVLLDNLTERLKNYDMSWHYVKFVEANQDQIPEFSGVYFFIVNPRSANIDRHYIILYIGKAKNLKKRFKDYFQERYGAKDNDREHVKKMLMVYKNRIDFAYCRIDHYETQKVEDMLVEAFCPCCNRASTNTVPAF